MYIVESVIKQIYIMTIERYKQKIIKQEMVIRQIQFHNTINKLKYGNTIHGYKLVKLT